MVEMHLVKMDLGLDFGQIEEVAANLGQLDRLMGKFPITVLLGFDGCAESPAKNLMSEANSCEADIGTMLPDICNVVSYCIFRQGLV